MHVAPAAKLIRRYFTAGLGIVNLKWLDDAGTSQHSKSWPYIYEVMACAGWSL